MKHVSVLLDECIESLDIKPGGVYVDGTLGRGGHSEKIAERLSDGLLIGIDMDETAISEAGERLDRFGGRVKLVRGNFRDTSAILDGLGIDKADGMLFDLGVSSPQLDESERGFSYMADAPLDMRMDTSATLTAQYIVNNYSEAELRRIFFDYGEERYAPRIARAIVSSRGQREIASTLELVEIIKSAMPAAALREKQHPAKRVFQAVRIAVNDELGSVEQLLREAPDKLAEGGRFCVISFHSLEDRLVKNGFSRREKGCTCPRDFPMCVCGFKQTLKILTRKPITPGAAELEANPRARSAKLRVAERV